MKLKYILLILTIFLFLLLSTLILAADEPVSMSTTSMVNTITTPTASAELPILDLGKKIVRPLGTGNLPIPLNSIITYTIALSNTGNTTATNVLVMDILPPTLDFEAWILTGSAQLSNTNTIVWQENIPANTNTQIQFTAHITSNLAFSYTTIYNTATFTSSNAGSGMDTASFFTIAIIEEEATVYLPMVLK